MDDPGRTGRTGRTGRGGAADKRRRQLAVLLQEGVVVPGPGDEVELAPVRILHVAPCDGADGPPGGDALVIHDRVLVPSTQLEAALGTLKEAEVPVARVIGRDPLPWAELVLAHAADLESALEQLAPLGVRAHHLLFAAHIPWVKVAGGDDPEPADPDAVHLADPGSGECEPVVAIVDNGLWPGATKRFPALAVEVDPGGSDDDPLYEWSTRRLGTGRTGPKVLDEAAGHGTFVAGVVRQLTGVAQVHLVRALDGRGVGTDVEVALGIVAALARAEVDVLNLSLAGYAAGGACPPLVASAIALAPAGSVVVVAAGNEAQDTDGPGPANEQAWPAALCQPALLGPKGERYQGPVVVAVGALANRSGWSEAGEKPEMDGYSNRGSHVAVSAPGDWVSTYVVGRENPLASSDGLSDTFRFAASAGGTSFAAAAVSGAIAKELAARRSAGGADDTAAEVLRRMVAAAPAQVAGGGAALDPR